MAERYLPRSHYWLLKWRAAARPPIHPHDMIGHQTFSSYNDALTFFKRLPTDSELLSLTLSITETKDFTESAIASLRNNEEGNDGQGN